MKVARRLALVSILVTQAPLSAASSAGPNVHFRSGEAPRVDLDVVGVAPSAIFEALAGILQRPLEMDAAVTGPLTVRLENVTIATALLAICESLDCRAELPERPEAALRITALPFEKRRAAASKDEAQSRSMQPISLSLKDAELVDVLATFGVVLGLKADLAEGIEGAVTVEMANVPANEALDQICAGHGLTWRIVEVGEGGSGARLEIRRAGS